jgi:hypothetical protein
MILPSCAEIVGHAKNGTLLNALFDDLWESRFYTVMLWPSCLRKLRTMGHRST